MQTIMDAASHIAEEIERTRSHLANLEQALAGLKPLMTIDVSSTTLFYSQVDDAQAVEDAFIVNVAKPPANAAKMTKAAKAAKATTAAKASKAADTVKATKPLKAQPVQAENAAATAGVPVGDQKPKASPKPKAGTTARKTPGDKSPAKAEPKAKSKVKLPVKEANTPRATAKTSTASTAPAPVASAAAAASPAVNAAGIPPTGATFWLPLAGRKAFSSSALTHAALQKLSLDASLKNVMANRARAWITASLKKGVLVAAGIRNGTHFYKLA